MLEYLIKTYSNVGDTILDCTMGSGSTGVAAINTNRQFIGIERDDKYFAIARTRIEAASPASLLSEMIDIESKPNAPEDKAA